MGAIVQFVKHTIMAMMKGFFFTGIITGILCLVVLFAASPTHHVVMGLSAVLAIVITVLAAFLGSAVALIYHLSHIEELSHAIKHVEEARAAERQRTRAS